jgi:type III pantothenate kinase
MTVLAIDAGNTRIKWGLHDGARWVVQDWSLTTAAGDLGTALDGLLLPDQIVISNVAGPAVQEALTGALSGFAAVPRWVQSRVRQCGVTSSYQNPEQLGADRWASLIGAWHLFHGPCAVINVGTTMTVDALSDEGIFLGGFIVPGIELMRDALSRGTAQLKLQQGAFTFFPVSTADAIMSGAVNALAGAAERMVHFMTATGQVSPLAVLSGGAAAVVAERLNVRHEVVDNLVLEGLLAIASGGD